MFQYQRVIGLSSSLIWRIVGVADFDADFDHDILRQNQSSRLIARGFAPRAVPTAVARPFSISPFEDERMRLARLHG